MRVALVVAVAHRSDGPSSSATTSTTERAAPSSAVQVRCWSRPRTTTRLPLASDSAACSAWSRHAMTVKNDGSWSRRPDTATRNMARAMGHSSSAAALRYQHVMAGRDAAIAAALDELIQAASSRSQDPAAGGGGTRVARTGQRRQKGKRR